MWLFLLGVIVGFVIAMGYNILKIHSVMQEKFNEIFAMGWEAGQQSMIEKAYMQQGIDQLEDWVNDEHY